MIGGFREKDRTRERIRLSWARAVIFFLWVILVFALISLFFSINNNIESNSTRRSNNSSSRSRSSSSHSIFPSNKHSRSSRLLTQQKHTTATSFTFNKPLFHAPISSSTTTTTSTNIGDPENTVYGDDKRIIHTGPNPLHN